MPDRAEQIQAVLAVIDNAAPATYAGTPPNEWWKTAGRLQWAAAIVDAGWADALEAERRFKLSRTVQTCDEVPIRSVAYNHADGSVVARFDATNGVVFGDSRPFPWQAKYLRGPLTLLWSEGEATQ